MENIVPLILSSVLGLFILYVVIETAVRRGINSSVIGRYYAKKDGDNRKGERFED